MKFLGIRRRGDIFTYLSRIFITTSRSRRIYITINIVHHPTFCIGHTRAGRIKRFINQLPVCTDADESDESFIVALKSPSHICKLVFIELYVCDICLTISKYQLTISQYLTATAGRAR